MQTQQALAIYATGHFTGTCLNLGEGRFTSLSMYEGKVLQHSVRMSDNSMENIIDFQRKSIQSKIKLRDEKPLSPAAQAHHVQEYFEEDAARFTFGKFSYVAEDARKEAKNEEQEKVNRLNSEEYSPIIHTEHSYSASTGYVWNYWNEENDKPRPQLIERTIDFPSSRFAPFQVSNERFQAPELLFKPLWGESKLAYDATKCLTNLHPDKASRLSVLPFEILDHVKSFIFSGEKPKGIHHQLRETILSASVGADSKDEESFRRVILCGGASMIPGLPERLLRELQKQPDLENVKIIAPPERKVSGWIGGSILATVPSLRPQLWVLKEDFEEKGDNIVNNFFF